MRVGWVALVSVRLRIMIDFAARRVIHRRSEVGQLKAPAAETVGNAGGLLRSSRGILKLDFGRSDELCLAVSWVVGFGLSFDKISSPVSLCNR